MRYEIIDDELRQIDADENFACRTFGKAVHRSFRKVMGIIRAARDERDLRSFKSLRLEQLAGNRKGQSSMRLNKQWRLIVKFAHVDKEQTAVVIEIVDYH